MSMKRKRHDEMPSSTHLLYQALEDARLWENVLTTLADELGADHVVVDFRADAEPHPENLVAARVDPTYFRQFAVHPEYPPLRGLVTKAASGSVLLGESIIDRRQQARSEFYGEVIRPMGGYHSLFGVTQHAGKDQTALLTACRTSRGKSFEARQRQRLAAFMPHLETALRLQRRLLSMTATNWWHEEVLNALPVGIILLDAHGLPCYANRMAESLLGTSDFLTLSARHGLTARDATANRQLRQALLGALGQLAPAPTSPVRLRQPGGNDEIWIRVAPLATGAVAFDAWSPARIMVLLDGPDSPALDPEKLARTFGFSPRETALAQTLLDGQELGAAATRLGVGRETVRSQLKSLFNKTETNRQAELAEVLRKFRRWSS